MPTFKQVFDCLTHKGPAYIESSRGTKYKVAAKYIKGRAAIVACPRRGRVTIHEDCWGYNITCQRTRAGGIYNGPYSIYNWYAEYHNR